MVYNELGQTAHYHVRTEQHLTTSQHFLGDKPPVFKRGGSAAKYVANTMGKPRAATSTLSLAPPNPMSKSQPSPSLTYRGNGDFIVELPHSTITYRAMRMTPNTQLTAWKTEYSAEYNKKKAFGGYSVLSSRRV